ncbi:MAG: alpha/beta fold hydrolase [Deltaproteobacteria bacterium]
MTVAAAITPNNIEICYETFGQEDKAPPIILISGAGLQMLGWPDEFCRMLAARGHRVIRFDNRDTGQSTILKHLPAPAPWRVALMHKIGFRVSPPYTLEAMAGDLVHLLDTLGVQRPHLVGISLGGMIAQVVAINSGERVTSLTCIATSARNSRHTMPKISTVLKIMRSPRPGRQGYIDWNIGLVRAVGGAAAEGPDDYLREIAGRMFDRGIHHEGMRRQVCAVYAAPDRRPALKRVAAPTLVIHGADDPLIHPEAGKEIAEAIPGARFCVIEGLGHGILRPVWPQLSELIGEHVERTS